MWIKTTAVIFQTTAISGIFTVTQKTKTSCEDIEIEENTRRDQGPVVDLRWPRTEEVHSVNSVMFLRI